MSDEEAIIEKNILKRLKRQKKLGKIADNVGVTGAPESPVEPRVSAEKEISEAIARSSVKAKRDKRRWKRIKQVAGVIAVGFLSYGIYLLFVPFKGDMTYGICKIYVELNTRFPSSLRFSEVEEFDSFVRIWYAYIDSFGEYRLEPIQCYYKADEKMGMVVDKITIDRREVDPQKVAEFNRILRVVLKSGVDLTLPAPLPDSLNGLAFDYSKYLTPVVEYMPGIR